MDNRYAGNHPGTSIGPIYADEKHPDDVAHAERFNATLIPLKQQWDELKNKLAAVVGAIPRGTRSKGWALACLEDADSSVAMLLDEAKE